MAWSKEEAITFEKDHNNILDRKICPDEVLPCGRQFFSSLNLQFYVENICFPSFTLYTTHQ